MSHWGGSDTGYVAQGPRTHIAIRRHLLHAAICASLLALCVFCCVAASTAPAATLTRSASAKTASSHSSSPGTHKRSHAGCARRASFHSNGKPSGGGKARHRRHATCHKHRAKHKAHAHHKTASAPVPHDGTCPDATLRPTSANIAEVRTATLCLVNRERLSRGEGALKPDGQLQQAAQSHSQDMSAGDYFDHDGRGGSTPLSRMRQTGYIFSSRIGYAVGENIAWATLGLASPKAIVAGWMSDAGHRANILEAKFRDTGIGVSPHPLASLARGQAGAIYTQDFGRIIEP
jgi:uncharacterized protein YkwD